MNKKEFINKWSNFWMFNKNAKELNIAFERELNQIIENDKKAINEIENAMERWHLARDNDDETLSDINDILVGLGLLSFFNKN